MEAFTAKAKRGKPSKTATGLSQRIQAASQTDVFYLLNAPRLLNTGNK
jgi:hypothetical protein